MEVDELTCTETVVEDLSNEDDLGEDDEQKSTQWMDDDGRDEMREESPEEEEIDADEEAAGHAASNNGAEIRHQPGEYQFQLLPMHVHQRGDSRTGVYKAFKCDICGMVYRHVFSLKRHFLRCHINYKYLTTTDITNCGIHMQVIQAAQNDSARNGDDLYRCHICNQLFPERDQLRSHTESHTSGKDRRSQASVSCGKCSLAFSDRKSLLKHQATHNGASSQANRKLTTLACKSCSKSFTTIQELRRHERLHEATDTTCKVCREHFTRDEFVHHKTSTHPDVNHVCSYCELIACDVAALGQHLFQLHGKTYSENMREIESKENGVTIKEEPLEVKPDRTADSTVSCDLCNKSFTSLVNLQRHNTVVHVKQLDKRSPQDHKAKLNGHRTPSEEEFYRTLAHRISENLQYHIDGRLPGSTQTSAFEPERVETNNCMPWLVNNFPPTLDITHIVQIYANRPPLASTNPRPAPPTVPDVAAPATEEQIALGACLGLNPVKKEIKQETRTILICQVCGHTAHCQREMAEHKVVAHPNVVATHLELEGHSSVPPELLTQFAVSTQGVLGSAPRVNGTAGINGVHGGKGESTLHKCTKCLQVFGTVSALHAHIVQCGSGHMTAFGSGGQGIRPPSPRQIKQRKFGPVLNTKRSEGSGGHSVSNGDYGKDDPRNKRKIDDRPQRRSARSTHSGGPSECAVCGQSFPSQASLRKHMLDECREEQSYRRKKRKESPTGTPEPMKHNSSGTIQLNDGWGDDFLDGKGNDQYQCKGCPATFASVQLFRRHQCPVAIVSSQRPSAKSLLSPRSAMLSVDPSGGLQGPTNGMSRSQYEEMTMIGLVQRAERDRQRGARDQDDTEEDEDTKVYRCPTCHMGFGDYVKMLHHSMQEHGASIPDAETFQLESSGARNGHTYHQRRHPHIERAERMHEEEVHENGVENGASQSSSQEASSFYDSEDLRDKERIAIEALSSFFTGMAHRTVDHGGHLHNNNNNESNKFPNRHAQPLMDHRY